MLGGISTARMRGVVGAREELGGSGSKGSEVKVEEEGGCWGRKKDCIFFAGGFMLVIVFMRAIGSRWNCTFEGFGGFEGFACTGGFARVCDVLAPRERAFPKSRLWR